MLARDVQVWWAGLDHAPDLMNDAERARHSRFHREADKRRFAVGCALLRLTVGAVLDREPQSVELDRSCTDCGRPHGKPRVVDGDGLEVSLSHAGERVGVALTRGAAVGIDVEETASGANHASLALTVLTDPEQAGDPATFIAYWTCKEAVLKATGDGLRVPLTAIVIADPVRRPRLAAWKGRPEMAGTTALYRLDPGPGYLAALAVLDPSPRTVHQHDATPLLAGH